MRPDSRWEVVELGGRHHLLILREVRSRPEYRSARALLTSSGRLVKSLEFRHHGVSIEWLDDDGESWSPPACCPNAAFVIHEALGRIFAG